MKFFCLNFFLLILCSLSAQSRIENGFANNPDYQPYTNWIDTSYAHCMQNWTTNMEWGACISDHHQHWFDFMNKEYNDLLDILNEEGKKHLIASQEAWKKNNIAQDDFWNYFGEVKANFFGREGTFGAYMTNLQNTRSRAVELHSYKEAFSYD